MRTVREGRLRSGLILRRKEQMQRVVTITIVVPNDHSEGEEDVTMKTNFDLPLKPNERCISAGIVNKILAAYQHEQVTPQ
jgi:hypothetical protein